MDNPEHLANLAFVEWLEWQKIKFTHIMQETFTTSWKQKNIIKQLVRKGFPDFIVIIAPEQSFNGKGLLIAVEMKKPASVLKNGKYSNAKNGASVEQLEWIESLNLIGNIQAKVCQGSNAAIEFVDRFLVH